MQRAGEELLVFRGLPGPRENLAFSQDKTFWYLTGVESPDAALVLDGKTKREILFLPAQDKRQEGWDGELWDAQDAWVKELTGFSEVVENGDGPGPYGAKGMSEGALLCVAAAVGSAVTEATGVVIRDLPLTPERVWRSIRAAREGRGVPESDPMPALEVPT